jgi:hypothetical protein
MRQTLRAAQLIREQLATVGSEAAGETTFKQLANGVSVYWLLGNIY